MPFKNPTKFNRKLLTRLFSKIRVSTDKFFNGSPCWEWTAAINHAGYGVIGYNCRMRPAHNVIYQLFVERLPEGWHADHLCRNRKCVNPIHVEGVTPRENSLRGESLFAQNHRKTHCIKGHPFDAENTYIVPNNKKVMRQCKICMTDRSRERDRRIAALPHDHPEFIKRVARGRASHEAKQKRLKSLPYDHPERVALREYYADYHRNRRKKKKNVIS